MIQSTAIKTAIESISQLLHVAYLSPLIEPPTVREVGVPFLAVAGQIHIERNGYVGTIILDHPERHNAISADMWIALRNAAIDLGDDEMIRVVVIKGSGEKAFAAGADISQFSEKRQNSESNDGYDDATSEAYAALSNLRKPLIAMIHGYCIGGGLAVALSADIRVASDDALFTIPAARLGLGYATAGLGKLVQLVGPSAAKRIMFLADRFGADEALSMGLINQVVPKASLEEHVAVWTDLISSNAPLTIAAAKASINEWLKDETARDFKAVDKMVQACFDSADYQEGVAAFMEKRKPRFNGR